MMVIGEDSYFRGRVGVVEYIVEFDSGTSSIYINLPGAPDPFRFRRDELAPVERD